MEKIIPEHIPFIVCVGRNYVKHIEEMNAERMKDPVIFFKPPTSAVFSKEIFLPKYLGKVHYEVEMTILIGNDCKNTDPDNADQYIEGYGVGIDFTLRDLQDFFKKTSLPWALCKGFDNAAPLSPFIKKEFVKDPLNMSLKLEKNGKIVQESNTGHMIFSPKKIISFCSRSFTLKKNYVIMTGTPEGVGPVESGDKLKALFGDMEMELNIIRE